MLGKCLLFDLVFISVDFQVSFRYHLQVIREWRAANQLIRVQVMKKCEAEQRHSLLAHDEPAETLLTEIRIVK